MGAYMTTSKPAWRRASYARLSKAGTENKGKAKFISRAKALLVMARLRALLAVKILST